MKKNKNFEKLLKNNTFLVNSAICLIILLSLCYLGISSPIKKTYSEHVSRLTKEDYSCPLGGNVLMTKTYQNVTHTLDRPVCSIYEVEVNNTGIGYDIGTNLTYRDQCQTYLDFQEQSHLLAKNIYEDIGIETGCYYYADLKQYQVTLIDETNKSLQGCYEWDDDDKYCEEYSPSTKRISFINDGVSLELADDYYFRLDDGTIVGWNTKADGSGTQYDKDDIVILNSDTTLYAVHQYSIELIDENNTLAECTSLVGDKMCSLYSEEYKKNIKIQPINNKISLYNKGVYYQIQESGDKLLGWSLSDDNVIKYEVDTILTLTGNIKLYTVWESDVKEPEEYAIIYNDNTTDTVTNMPEAVLKKEGESINISSTVPKRNGYIFDGWYDNKSYTGSKYNAGDLYDKDADLTLYAKWFKPYEIDSSYTIDEELGYLIVSKSTSKSDFESKFTLNGDYKLNVETKIVENVEKVFTGGKIEIKLSDDVYKTYKTVVLGDVDGSGDLDYRDYVLVYNHIKKSKDSSLPLKLLEKEKLVAGDILDDNNINYRDYVLIYNEIVKQK